VPHWGGAASGGLDAFGAGTGLLRTVGELTGSGAKKGLGKALFAGIVINQVFPSIRHCFAAAVPVASRSIGFGLGLKWSK